MVVRPSLRVGRSWEALSEDREGSEGHLRVPAGLGKPSHRSGTDQETLPSGR